MKPPIRKATVRAAITEPTIRPGPNVRPPRVKPRRGADLHPLREEGTRNYLWWIYERLEDLRPLFRDAYSEEPEANLSPELGGPLG